ncbi:MAG: hypothetical protein HYZ73_03375 [Elusimicrobia bacterium]|nr:hypothetical protein [Elusimicrobiota bacterium]
MRYEELRKRMRARRLFRGRDLHLDQRMRPHELVQLSRWATQGKLIRLKRGLYTLPDEERPSALSLLWLADKLYSPSYISLEYALGHYGLIPEAVGEVTCVTTLKTQTIRNIFGGFSYHTIKRPWFFGFKARRTPDGVTYWMADPEKALLDFFYFSLPPGRPPDRTLLVKGYRLQNLDQLQRDRLEDYLSRFSVARVQAGGVVLLQLLKTGTR